MLLLEQRAARVARVVVHNRHGVLVNLTLQMDQVDLEVALGQKIVELSFDSKTLGQRLIERKAGLWDQNVVAGLCQ